MVFVLFILRLLCRVHLYWDLFCVLVGLLFCHYKISSFVSNTFVLTFIFLILVWVFQFSFVVFGMFIFLLSLTLVVSLYLKCVSLKCESLGSAPVVQMVQCLPSFRSWSLGSGSKPCIRLLAHQGVCFSLSFSPWLMLSFSLSVSKE